MLFTTNTTKTMADPLSSCNKMILLIITVVVFCAVPCIACLFSFGNKISAPVSYKGRDTQNR